jgi:hypothetical protein
MTAYDDILRERVRQAEKHGGPERDDQHGPHDWITFIAMHAGLGRVREDDTEGMALDRFRKQMVIVAALTLAAIESTDRQIARLTEGSH